MSDDIPSLTLDGCRIEWLDGNSKKAHIDAACDEIMKSSVEMLIQEPKGGKPAKNLRVVGIRAKTATVANKGLLPQHFVIAIGRPKDFSEDLSEDESDTEEKGNDLIQTDGFDRISLKHGRRRILKYFPNRDEWKVVSESAEDRSSDKRYFIYIFNLPDFAENIPDQLIAIIQDEDITKASHFVINDMKSLAKAVDILPQPAARQYIDINMLIGWTLENDCFEKFGLNDLLQHTLNMCLPHKMRALDERGYSRIPKISTHPNEAALETLAYLRICEFCFDRLIEDEKASKVKIDEIRKAFKRQKFVSVPNV